MYIWKKVLTHFVGWSELLKQFASFHLSARFEKGSKEFITWQINALKHSLDQGCYSEEWLDFYFIRAKQLGLKEVGIVDHFIVFKRLKLILKKI